MPTTARISRDKCMPQWADHRAAVQGVLKKKGRSVYWLHAQLQSHVTISRHFLYAYLRGETGISEEKMHGINKILGIKFTDE